MGKYEEQMVPIKISRLAEYIAEKKRITSDEALMYIYVNPLYKELYNENAKWWYLSAAALYDEFESARKAIVKHVSNEAFEFYTYCLEKYALAKEIGGLQSFALFKEYQVDDFLMDHYDLLHTQGTEYVIDEIQRLINKSRKK